MTRPTPRAALMAAALATLALPAAADPTLECSGSAGSQVEIGQCMAGIEALTEQAMGLALGFAATAAASLDEVTGRTVAAPALEAGQAAFLAYREAHCDFVGATFGGGSGTGIGIRACRIELTRARVSELMRYTQ